MGENCQKIKEKNVRLKANNCTVHGILATIVVPTPGDWPTWLYIKKLIAQAKSDDTIITSLISEQGPFNVSLNLQEQIVIQYQFLFDKFHRHLFSKPLPQNPKPHQRSMLISSLLLGWLMVRDKIISKFSNCNDPQYVLVLFVLEEVVPLGFFQYFCIFRGGNLEKYLTVMVRIAMIFIIWKRRHYNKSPLSMLSDIEHQRKNLHNYFSTKKKWLSLFTEKKVEVFHSELRSKITPWASAEFIQNIAKCINAKNFQISFQRNFVKSNTSRENSNRDWTTIAGMSAEYLINLFKSVAQNIGKSYKLPRELDKRGKLKGPILYWFPIFEANVKHTCMPLGYSFQDTYPNADPHPDYRCDLQSCKGSGSVCHLACFHSFHDVCLNGVSKCPIFNDKLHEKIKELSSKFNSSLFEPTKSKHVRNIAQSNDQDEDEHLTVRPAPQPQTRPAPAPQPQTRPAPTPQPQTRPAPTPQTSVNPVQSTSLTRPQLQMYNHQNSIVYSCISSTHYWFFPHHISQSTINGRHGSTACTLIAILMANRYHNTKPALQLFANGISHTWLPLLTSSIIAGNKLHDDMFHHAPVYLQVQMASRLLASQISKFQLGQELPVNFTTVRGDPDTSNLEYYLRLMIESTSNSCSAIVTFRANTFAFAKGAQRNIILLDSHLHSQYGALIASCHANDISSLLQWMKSAHFSTNFNLCTLTMINFL